MGPKLWGNNLDIGFRNMGSMQNSLRQAHLEELAVTWRIASESRLNFVMNDSAVLAVSALLDSLVIERRVLIPIDATTVGLDLTNLGLDTLDNARTALGGLDSALNQVNSMRADMGAYRNRLESAPSTTLMAMEGEQVAVSRMRDADMAVEVAAKTQASLM
jgi:flagellin-like hook-associated protein FlgL